MIEIILIDYDNTLHDSDSKFVSKLGKKWWKTYLKVHRNLIHPFFPDKHDDYEFQCKLVFKRLHQTYDATLIKQKIEAYLAALKEVGKTNFLSRYV